MTTEQLDKYKQTHKLKRKEYKKIVTKQEFNTPSKCFLIVYMYTCIQ